jgi:hypothetical protein
MKEEKLSPIEIMCNSLSGLVFEKGNTFIYVHSLEWLENSYRLDLTNLSTDERRKEVLTNPFFESYKEVSNKELFKKGFYERANDLRVSDGLYEQSQPSRTKDGKLKVTQEKQGNIRYSVYHLDENELIGDCLE